MPCLLALQRLHFCQAASVTGGATKPGGQKGFDQFQGERRPEAKDVHVVVFNALTGRENIMD
jgi:hypothetical protein